MIIPFSVSVGGVRCSKNANKEIDDGLFTFNMRYLNEGTIIFYNKKRF